MVPQTAAKVAVVVDVGVGVWVGLTLAARVATGAREGALDAGAVQATTNTLKSAVRIGDLTLTECGPRPRGGYLVTSRIGPDSAPTSACVCSLELSRCV
jgi:hypothetical protein